MPVNEYLALERPRLGLGDPIPAIGWIQIQDLKHGSLKVFC